MIEFENAEMIYPNGTKALENISLKIAPHEGLVLFGASGCGKTTLLKLMAGLLQPSKGAVQRSGNISMVFQKALLFGHMSAYENIAFGLEQKKKLDIQQKKQVEQMAFLCHCGDFLYQKAATLSGGQKQRVALARALVSRPDVLLMDEPFSHLDEGLKYQMVRLVQQLRREMDFSLVYVSHDRNEVESMQCKIAYMEKGKILQTDFYADMIAGPASVQVARHFLYPGMNLFESSQGWWGFYSDAVRQEKEPSDLMLTCKKENWKESYQGKAYQNFLGPYGNFSTLSLTPLRAGKLFVSKSSLYYFDCFGKRCRPFSIPGLNE